MTTIDLLILIAELLCGIAALGIIIHWFVLLFDVPHKWNYRNPYDRTCTKCKRHEQEECWADDYARYGMRASGTWEVFHEGDGSCEKKEKGS